LTDPLIKLSDAGVSIWLDDLSRVRFATTVGFSGVMPSRSASSSRSWTPSSSM
jgi:hypothetical protein